MEKTEILTDEQLEDAFETFTCMQKTQRKRKQKELQAQKLTSSFLAWELCIEQFAEAFENGKRDAKTVGNLCWYLNEYLASWGMTRNSKLTRENCEMQKPAVRAILKFSDLRGKDLADFRDADGKAYRRLEELCETLKECCAQFSRAQEPRASGTLISKTILGTLGIVPGYDQKVCGVLKKYDITTGTFNMKSFRQFAVHFTEHHVATIDRMTKELQETCPRYTRVKVIDSLLWFLGQDISK